MSGPRLETVAPIHVVIHVASNRANACPITATELPGMKCPVQPSLICLGYARWQVAANYVISRASPIIEQQLQHVVQITEACVSCANLRDYRLTPEHRNLADATCQISPRCATAHENWRKRVYFWINANSVVGRSSMLRQRTCIPGRSGSPENLCEDCPMNLVTLMLHVKEQPRCQGKFRL